MVTSLLDPWSVYLPAQLNRKIGNSPTIMWTCRKALTVRIVPNVICQLSTIPHAAMCCVLTLNRDSGGRLHTTRSTLGASGELNRARNSRIRSPPSCLRQNACLTEFRNQKHLGTWLVYLPCQMLCLLAYIDARSGSHHRDCHHNNSCIVVIMVYLSIFFFTSFTLE